MYGFKRNQGLILNGLNSWTFLYYHFTGYL